MKILNKIRPQDESLKHYAHIPSQIAFLLMLLTVVMQSVGLTQIIQVVTSLVLSVTSPDVQFPQEWQIHRPQWKLHHVGTLSPAGLGLWSSFPAGAE